MGGNPASLPTPSDVREKARRGGGTGPRRGSFGAEIRLERWIPSLVSECRHLVFGQLQQAQPGVIVARLLSNSRTVAHE